MRLPEVEDSDHLPPALRRYMTDYLTALFRILPVYAAAPDLLAPLCAPGTVVTDCCSGGGGPAVDAVLRVRESVPGVTVTLTDKYPPPRDHAPPLPPFASYHPSPVDVTTDVPPGDGPLTFFTSLHHFTLDELARMFSAAAAAGRPVAGFEITSPTAPGLASVLVTPLVVPLVTPFIRPFDPARLFLTYVIPIVPLLAAWDGVASVSRSYSPDELLGAAKNAAGLSWSAGRVRALGPLRMTWIIGAPARVGTPAGAGLDHPPGHVE